MYLPAARDLLLSVSELPAGMYYVVADIGGKQCVEKLVVK
jgi:hypothetical protein